MNQTVMRMRLMILLLMSVGVAMVVVLQSAGEVRALQNLQVHFLDVGQGDAIFIQTPDGVEVLIDGGANNSVLRGLSSEMSFFDRKIDMIIATHPDADHTGGLIDVLERYDVATVLQTENKGSSNTAVVYMQAVESENAQVVCARAGQVFQLGEVVTLKVLFPVYNAIDMESNASSIVVQIIYGETQILLTGDSPKRIEEYLTTQTMDLESDILKLGHHGSRTSTSEVFLDAVNPTYAVISAGEDNRYGHPHKEVTDMLDERKIQTYNTAQEGTITFESDGKSIWME